MGALYRLTPKWRLLAGLHKGFNPPAPGSSASEEESLNFETGARYDGGVVDFLEVLDTERTLFNAELAQSETLQLYFSAIVQLYGALGGGWSVEES